MNRNQRAVFDSARKENDCAGCAMNARQGAANAMKSSVQWGLTNERTMRPLRCDRPKIIGNILKIGWDAQTFGQDFLQFDPFLYQKLMIAIYDSPRRAGDLLHPAPIFRGRQTDLVPHLITRYVRWSRPLFFP